jgi:hypothetical protein
MLKQTANFQPFQFGEDALAASRQVWLASLGAAAVTRDWVQTEATRTFKTLVKEGTVVESRAVSVIGNQIETSMTRANTMWKRTRRTVEATVKQAADTAVALAQQALPATLPKIDLPMMATVKKAKPRKTAAKPVKAARARVAKVAKKVKRAVKSAKA